MQQPGPQEWGRPPPDDPAEEPPAGPAPPMLARLTTFSTGVLRGVRPGSIPARSQTSPHVRRVSAIGWETSTISAVVSQRYSYLGMPNDIGVVRPCPSPGRGPGGYPPPMHRMLIAACTGMVGLLASGVNAEGGGLTVEGLTYEREWSNASLDIVMPRHTEPFGTARKTWWSFGGAVATYFGDETDYQIHGAFHHFVADDVEVIGELGLWYADQNGPNTYGVNPQLGLRWHFLQDEDKRTWSVFAELGIGALWTEKNAPAGGTSLNFTPRGGVGFTHRIGDGPARFIAGVRHHHISNARIEGDANNPARDMPLVHFGFMFPF